MLFIEREAGGGMARPDAVLAGCRVVDLYFGNAVAKVSHATEYSNTHHG
jgi:hypothetical protein